MLDICDKGGVWAWNSGSVQLIINFGLEGLVDRFNPQDED